jgi:hypothetical protein
MILPISAFSADIEELVNNSELASNAADPNYGPPEKTGFIATIGTIGNELNATNTYIANTWDKFNKDVDIFFTNQRSNIGENKSSILVYTSFYKKEGRKMESEFDFQIRIDLPNTTKKLKIVIEKQQDEIANVLTDNSVSTNKNLEKNGKISRDKEVHYTAGTNFLLTKSKYFVSFLHFGIRLDMPLNPSVKLDFAKELKYKKYNISLSQKFIYYRQEGLQEISQILINKKLNDNFQTNFINSLVWTEVTDDFILRNNLTLNQDLGDEKTLSYSVGANAVFSPSVRYDSYDASISYRQLLYKDWLYGTLTTGIDFPRANGFKSENFVQLRFDIFFKERPEKVKIVTP